MEEKTRTNRKLALAKETLKELSARDLAAAAGGIELTGYYPTINSPCGPSVHICPA